jgi:hypothetical protein
LGGTLGGVTLFLGEQRPPLALAVGYSILVLLFLTVAGVAFVADRTTRGQRIDSVEAIREDLEQMLRSFPPPSGDSRGSAQ